MYDVRFATDSVVERVAHACHFGVMVSHMVILGLYVRLILPQVGLAIVGPQFDPKTENWSTFQQLSLILMVSRLVLLCQYGFSKYVLYSLQ